MNINTYFDESHGRSWNFVCAFILLGFLAAVVAMCIVGIHFANKGMELLPRICIFIAGMGSYFWGKGVINFIQHIKESKK